MSMMKMAMGISYPSHNLTFLSPPRSYSLQPLSSSFSCLRHDEDSESVKLKCIRVGREGAGSNPKAGVSLYKPKSYKVLVTDAANSLALALQDGLFRLEIDFPPLPTNISSYKGSSDEFIDANVQLALSVVRKLKEINETRACIVFPDKPEKRRASELFKAALDSIDAITIGSLDDVPAGPMTSFFRSVRNTLDFDFEDENEGRWQSSEPPSLYIFINCSTRELGYIEKYVVRYFCH